MMKTFAAALFFVMLTSVIQSQQTTPVPLTPDQIFVEGVQWSLVEPAIEPVKIDNNRRIVSVLDTTTNTWYDYPFPDDVPQILVWDFREDGTIMLYFSNEARYFSTPGSIIMLDPKTRLFGYPPTICDGKIIQADPGKGSWRFFYFDDSYQDGFLCHTETGEKREILPKSSDGWSAAFNSPDGRYVVLVGTRDTDLYQVFAYNVQDNQFTELGTIYRGSDTVVSLCAWITTSEGLLCTTDHNRSYIPTNYHTFDVAQTDSLTYLFEGGSQTTFKLDDPLRYVSMYTEDYFAFATGSQMQEHPPCTLRLYDAEEDHREELGYECIPLILGDYSMSLSYRNGDIIYYVTTEEEVAAISTLRSYDVKNKRGNEPIFTGEVETILSVSPDNRYIVFALDDNGVVDFPWDIQGCCPLKEGMQIVVFDQHEATIIYQSEPIGVYAASQVRWIDSTNVIISAAVSEDAEKQAIAPTIRRVDVSTGQALISREWLTEDGRDYLNISGNYLLIEDNILIDLCTFEQVPLLREDIPEAYNIYATWAEDDTLQVPAGDAVYRIALP